MNPPLTIWERLAGKGNSPALAQTFSYYAAFIALGLTTAVIGPTLQGLAQQTNSSVGAISFLFTARSFGYMLGALGGGRLLDRLPGHRTMAGAVLFIALALACVPFAPLLWILILIVFIIGFMESIVDVGGNTLIIWVHREAVAPYMNGLHLFFAVGAFISPLLIAQAILFTGNFRMGYWLLALLLLPVVLLLFPLRSPAPIVSHQERASARPNYVLVMLVAAFLLLVAGAEISYSGWIATYATKTGLADDVTAALITAAFWGAFMVGRAISIPLAARVRPRLIILFDLLLATGGIAVLLAFPASVLAVWGGTMLFGLGIASTFPTMLTFAGRHMTITATVTGLFFVGASMGNLVMPTLIGQLFERVSPASLLWVIGTMTILAFGVFALSVRVANRNKLVTQTH